MIRKMIKIDEDKCNGCGLCVTACHEGAIGLVDGKAILLRDDYCDGLGACLPACPVDAISFVEREAAAYDEEAVKANIAAKSEAKKQAAPEPSKLACGCPGTASRSLIRKEHVKEATADIPTELQSELNQWPVQIKLVPVNAPYFKNADLLVAADCTAYAYADFHRKFMKNKITIIGCPKLDFGEYSEKLTDILKANNIKSVTVVRMEVPCCGGIVNSCVTALRDCGKMIPWQIVTISTSGEIIDN